jgi:hypothetical protein
MGWFNRVTRKFFRAAGHFATRSLGAGTLILGTATITSCTVVPPAPTNRLLTHRALIDFTGLAGVQSVPSLKLTAAAPQGWQRLPAKKTALYTHEQWRSPSTTTGVGAVYVHLPLPLSAKTIAWFAKQEYGKRAADGKLLSEWTDDLGRTWFEAQNKKYRIRGYVTTRGMEAWIVYTGYRLTTTPDAAEISLAMRSAETFVPLTSAPPTTQPVAQKLGSASAMR